MTLTGAGKVAGVIGWPIAHSLSPVVHGYWLRELDVDGALVPLAVARENFARVIRALQMSGFQGVNVTLPPEGSDQILPILDRWTTLIRQLQ